MKEIKPLFLIRIETNEKSGSFVSIHDYETEMIIVRRERHLVEQELFFDLFDYSFDLIERILDQEDENLIRRRKFVVEKILSSTDFEFLTLKEILLYLYEIKSLRVHEIKGFERLKEAPFLHQRLLETKKISNYRNRNRKLSIL